MDDRSRHTAIDYGHVVFCIAALIFAVSVAVFVCWMVLSKQDSKLYESDNMVCASQPFSMQCWERKPR